MVGRTYGTVTLVSQPCGYMSISVQQLRVTPSRSLDDNCSAGSPCLCARCARILRPHTHTTCERGNDANASSEVEGSSRDMTDGVRLQTLMHSFTEGYGRQCTFPVCCTCTPALGGPHRANRIENSPPRYAQPGEKDASSPRRQLRAS